MRPFSLSADNWPVPATPTPFYLREDRTLSSQTPEAAKARVAFDYDPLNPVPTRGGCLLLTWKEEGTGRKVASGTYDQRDLQQRPDVITFTTEPLAEPLEVTGRLAAKLYVISDRIRH